MEVLVKKHKGAWWVFINHKNKRKARKVGEKKAALDLKAKIEKRLNAEDLGFLEKTPGTTLAEAADRWLEGYVRLQLKARSYEVYSRIFTKHIKPAFGDVPLQHLTRKRIKDFLASLDMKPRYVQTVLATLSGILTQAVEDEEITHNAAARLGKFTKRRNGGEDAGDGIKYWTQEQLGRILARATQDYPAWNDLFTTMAWTGLRVGEALGLQWDDLDFSENVISLKRTVTRVASHVRQGAPKGNRSRRVEMAGALAGLLQDRQSRLASEYALKGQQPPAWVFPAEDRGPLTYNSTLKTLQHILDLEKIPKYERAVTHIFRHSWATWVLQNGDKAGAIMYVSKQLGHASVKTTLDVYGHLIPDENRHLSDLMADTMRSGGNRNLPATEVVSIGK